MKTRLPLILLALLVVAAGMAAFVVYGGWGGLLAGRSQVMAGAEAGQGGGLTATQPAMAQAGDGSADIQPGLFQKLSPAPSLAGVVVTDAQGADVDLGGYKGKSLLLNVWATWCAPCVAEMPSLNRLQAKLGSDSFAVVPVAVDEASLDKVKAFLVDHQLDKLPALLDANHALDRVLKVAALPTSLLVSPDGKILARFTGDNKWDCGKAQAAVEAFAKSGEIATGMLEPCPD
ncbi:MAG: TlpA disulfide reductase family protein [Dongiaceae bacterium]